MGEGGGGRRRAKTRGAGRENQLENTLSRSGGGGGGDRLSPRLYALADGGGQDAFNYLGAENVAQGRGRRRRRHSRRRGLTNSPRPFILNNCVSRPP